MHTLKNWKVKRSGPRMTVTGTSEASDQERKAGVDEVFVRDGKVIAVQRGLRDNDDQVIEKDVEIELQV